MSSQRHSQQTSQVLIVHLSDLHFGKSHRFIPAVTIAGDRPDEESFPTLLDRLADDLQAPDPGCPVLICITGDLVETGDLSEFKDAERFLTQLARTPIFGRARGIESIFVVPGNHDVKYAGSEVGDRWQQWIEFYNRIFGTAIRRESPWDLVAVHDRADDLQSIIVCLNSAIYVQKDKSDEDRGRLDIKQLTRVEEQLEALDKEKLKKAVRIALIHHHPVLIPSLAEPGRGYDAVHNSGSLLSILRRHGFQIILHGHKHNPHTFTDDTRPAYQDTSDLPIFIAAGGSLGSINLPPLPRIANCYNQINVKWHPAGRQARVRAVTRGLNIFNNDGTDRLPTRWNWTTTRVDDRHFYGFDCIPEPHDFVEREFNSQIDESYDLLRQEEYQRTRGNLPVAQVLPSLIPGQAYEAVLWIVPHPYGKQKSEYEHPVEVTWSAGRKFEVISVLRANDRHFSARLAYWGPVLVQARLKFSDGHEAISHVYARMPEFYGDDC